MKRLLLAVFLVPSLALASHHEKAATPSASEKAAAPSASDDPMANWVPPKVKNEAKDKQEIQSLFKAMETAGRTGDLDAAVALVDFPVTMITDDSKGEAMGEAWSREQWIQVMKPFYDKPMKDMKVTHKPTVFLLSDSLASVDDVCTMTKGGKTITSRNSMFVIRKDGKWRVKAMAEGGWGDMMAEAPAHAASSGTQETPSGTATGGATEPPGSQGTGSGSMGSGTPGSESGSMGSGSQGTGSGSMGSGTPGSESGSMGSGSQGTGSGSMDPAAQGTKGAGSGSGTGKQGERTTK